MTPPAVPLRVVDASLSYADRLVWSDLSLDVAAGEFLAVLGGNGSGKTSLLRAVLGLHPLTSGRIEVDGADPRVGRRRVGYVPQQRSMDPLTPLRARDLVMLGLDGQRLGVPRGGRGRRAAVDAALAAAGASRWADQPVAALSGGEQQLVRVAQAIVSDPDLLLCDEPLLSLDLSHQRLVASLVDERRRADGTAVVFVTHDVNPVLPYVDRVLYLAGGRFSIGAVDDVLTSETLSDLYGTPVEVIRSSGRILVAGVPSGPASEHHHHGAQPHHEDPAHAHAHDHPHDHRVRSHG